MSRMLIAKLWGLQRYKALTRLEKAVTLSPLPVLICR